MVSLIKQSLQCIYVQLFSRVRICATLWTIARQASLSITNSQSLLKLMSIVLVMPANHFILCCPLLLSSIIPSIRVFSNESVLCIRWPKYWSFSFSISPSNECSGLISFMIDWFELLAVQGTLKILLQPHSSKPPVLQCSAFLHFFFLGMVLIPVSCTMSRTSVHSSSGTLSYLIPWISLSLPLYNCKGFDLGHIWMV